MKNLLKFGFLALAITLTVAACSSSKTTDGAADSDSIAAADSAMAADSAAMMDTTKMDSAMVDSTKM